MSFFGLEIGEGGFKQERRDFFPSKIQDDSTLIIFILLMAFTGWYPVQPNHIGMKRKTWREDISPSIFAPGQASRKEAFTTAGAELRDELVIELVQRTSRSQAKS